MSCDIPFYRVRQRSGRGSHRPRSAPLHRRRRTVWRQFFTTGLGRNGAKIDLLCTDGSGDLVAVELKAVEAEEGAVAQTGMYIGWVRERLASLARK